MNVCEYLEFPRESKFCISISFAGPPAEKDAVRVTQAWRTFESGGVLQGTTRAATQATLSEGSASRGPGKVCQAYQTWLVCKSVRSLS